MPISMLQEERAGNDPTLRIFKPEPLRIELATRAAPERNVDRRESNSPNGRLRPKTLALPKLFLGAFSIAFAPRPGTEVRLMADHGIACSISRWG
jgi:hypothetical protein